MFTYFSDRGAQTFASTSPIDGLLWHKIITYTNLPLTLALAITDLKHEVKFILGIVCYEGNYCIYCKKEDAQAVEMLSFQLICSSMPELALS